MSIRMSSYLLEPCISYPAIEATYSRVAPQQKEQVSRAFVAALHCPIKWQRSPVRPGGRVGVP